MGEIGEVGICLAEKKPSKCRVNVVKYLEPRL